jgi:hypothetical protein
MRDEIVEMGGMRGAGWPGWVFPLQLFASFQLVPSPPPSHVWAPSAGGAPAKRNPSTRLRIIDVTMNLDSEYRLVMTFSWL